jgi:hypothetical protein
MTSWIKDQMTTPEDNLDYNKDGNVNDNLDDNPDMKTLFNQNIAVSF